MENKTIIVQINNDELFKKLQENNNKCLCTVNETDCMCDEFKNTNIGICHCGVFVKKYAEKEQSKELSETEKAAIAQMEQYIDNGIRSQIHQTDIFRRG